MYLRHLKEETEPTKVENVGGQGAVFGLALGQMLLTILTLGIGRFWMITRLRKFYWSSFRVEGEPLEYTGRAMEKLIGFFIAVVILAVYLVIVNLAMTFVGLSYFQGEALALNLSILAVTPLLFWAQYRARRYILGRTRWRGIRFGVTPAAWGYTLRAMLLWALTIATLGLAFPYLQISLARYTTNRTWFGDLRFHQHGTMWPLMRSWLLVIAPLLIAAAFAATQWSQVSAEFSAIDWSLSDEAELPAISEGEQGVLVGLALFTVFGGVWAAILYINHSVYSFRYLYSNKTLGGETAFEVRLGFWSVVGIHLFGGLIISILFSLIMTLLSAAVAVAVIATGTDPGELAKLAEWELPAMSGIAAAVSVAAAYLLGIAVFVGLSNAFITMPLMKMMARTTSIYGMEAVGRARQRARDEQAEAGGFADALGADVGGAF